MTFSCPKCNSPMEEDVALLSEEGKAVKCPSCNAGSWLIKESFARRAVQSGTELVCAHCGDHLGDSIFCLGCKELFPDYFVVTTGKTRRKKARKAKVDLSKGFVPRIERGPAGVKKSAAVSAHPLVKVLTPVALLVPGVQRKVAEGLIEFGRINLQSPDARDA